MSNPHSTHGRRPANEPLSQKIARRAITTTTAICCIPCICCMLTWLLCKGAKDYVKNYKSPRVQRERKEEKLRAQIPRAVQTRGESGLERCLTIGRMTYQNGSDAGAQVQVTGMGRDVDAIGKRGRTDYQDQSFFFKLPEEIRRQIYEELISGYTFHIRYIEAYRRMGHTRCKSRLPDTCKCLYYARQKGAPDKWGQVNLLAPLQTCRRMYSEGIEMLYQNNTFDFESLITVLKLSFTVLPERMQMIRSVQWRYAYPYLTGSVSGARPDLPNIDHKLSQITLPWLVCCRTDSPCSCLACMPATVSTDDTVLNTVLYKWLMLSIELKQNNV